ncbi:MULTISPECIES: DUF1284 domain-containing protein [Clostridium]|uniref:DUF1284 domain-containing protein n=1 Tax=Clostridium cibarium TaxID=2762247 RepID=A0ABR8PYK6_9CLOT|nr:MULTISPECIES: DUF1284 domain-containing protein [Clostridium]MBD7913249.1 DUF1284 domain-containing protein [Clostridium cibarium]
MIKIRPHHINCIYFYKGLGYSEKFIKEMDKIVGLLKSEENVDVKLVNCCDDICENCPNKLQGEICLTKDKVNMLDKLTLREYGLQINSIYSFSYIEENIYRNYSKEKFKKICKDCEWYKNGTCM